MGMYKGMLKHKFVVLGLILVTTAFLLMGLTQSRGALLACFASVIVFIVGIALKDKWTLKKINSYIIVAVILAGSFVSVSTFLGLNLNRNIAKDGRVALIESSWHMIGATLLTQLK